LQRTLKHDSSGDRNEKRTGRSRYEKRIRLKKKEELSVDSKSRLGRGKEKGGFRAGV